MSGQVLDRVLTAYRIGDPAGDYPIFDSTGSKLWPGRWNTSLSPMIYTSEHYSAAMLEKLVHGAGRMPPNQHWISITIPSGVSYEMFSTAHHPGWEAEDCIVSKTYGEAWWRSKRSLLLIVPSVVARMERNILINDNHPEAHGIIHDLHQPIWWDGRLFSPLAGVSPPPTASPKRRAKP
ncbi:MAG: RES domain-containing protein [Gemmatimonadaceae bacterium]|uniref:RES family NAD+ phosphorylase n=1 Tax=Caulobacter sp. DWP3-1-3b2 TaxID=2804643 RepID=UPI0019C0084B|nr:RES domain-containing protein [Caulobacter sp.]